MHFVRFALPRLSLFLILLAASLFPTGCDKKTETPTDTKAGDPANTATNANTAAALPSPTALCLLTVEKMDDIEKAVALLWIAEAMA